MNGLLTKLLKQIWPCGLFWPLFFFSFHIQSAEWNGQDSLSLNDSAVYSLDASFSSNQSTWTKDFQSLQRPANQTMYFRIPVTNSSRRDQTLWFSIPFAAIKKLTVKAGEDEWQTGDAYSFNSRPIVSPDYLFPVFLPAGETTLIEGSMAGEILRFSFFLHKPEVIMKQQRETEFRDMFFFGTMTTLALCCLLCFLATRSNAYLSFAAFSFSLTFMLFRVFGYGFEFIWPGYPSINDATYILAIYSSAMSGGWMVNALLSGDADSKKYSKTMYFLVYGLGFAGVFSALLLDLQTTLLLPIYWSIPLLLLAVVRIAIEYKQGSPEARFLAIGIIPLFIGCTVLVLAAMQHITWGDYIVTTLMGCIALSSLLLALFISASLFRLLKKQRDAEHEQFEIKAAYAQKLEIEVAIRTQELQRSNEKLGELALRDPLTGLPNRRSLDIFVDQKLAENPDTFAIALLDLDHFKKINDIYGHDVGDSVLIAVADILKPFNSDYTIAGRFGGEEFAYLSVNRVHQAVQLQIDQIHKQISDLRIDEHPNLEIKISVGWVMADPKETVGESFRRADKALYHAKENGRDQIIEFPLPKAG